MKKIMIIAVAAIALAACSRTFDTAPVQPKEIGFNTWTELLTKVRTQGSSAFAAGDDFAVYGFKDKSTPAPVTEFDDVVVSTTDGSVWTYSPKKIWDTSYDSYTFYAISPAAIGTDPDATVDPQTGEIESDDITFAGNDNDILVADKVTVAKTDGAEFFNGYGKVALVFNHITSKVDIVVKKSTNLDGLSVRIDEISLVRRLHQKRRNDRVRPPRELFRYSGISRRDLRSGEGIRRAHLALL